MHGDGSNAEGSPDGVRSGEHGGKGGDRIASHQSSGIVGAAAVRSVRYEDLRVSMVFGEAAYIDELSGGQVSHADREIHARSLALRDALNRPGGGRHSPMTEQSFPREQVQCR